MTAPTVTPDDPGLCPGEIRGPRASARWWPWTPARAALRRRLAGVTYVLAAGLVLLLIATALARDTAAELRAFAHAAGLLQTEEFVETITSLRDTKRLPARYVTKKDAEALGWKPGADLCRTTPGRAIGGDNFGNREKRLPEAAGRRWREADLDYACGRRGPKRLVWSNDGLIFITVDHYATFKEVPR